ncbi:hypothetical protein X777_16918 [Ooceraea biroi]|uniref:Uncharacterized protein n=1 Tax=Ooceraea biroi TaxID=2015173 RepID=A0A026WV30_OOCBI|nr:hypothetical protein X777_16918 [Ooceraea biroi]
MELHSKVARLCLQTAKRPGEEGGRVREGAFTLSRTCMSARGTVNRDTRACTHYVQNSWREVHSSSGRRQGGSVVCKWWDGRLMRRAWCTKPRSPRVGRRTTNIVITRGN